jgi:hypothetical protein
MFLPLAQKHYSWSEQPLNKGVAAIGVFGTLAAGTGITFFAVANHQHQNGKTLLGPAKKQ